MMGGRGRIVSLPLDPPMIACYETTTTTMLSAVRDDRGGRSTASRSAFHQSGCSQPSQHADGSQLGPIRCTTRVVFVRGLRPGPKRDSPLGTEKLTYRPTTIRPLLPKLAIHSTHYVTCRWDTRQLHHHHRRQNVFHFTAVLSYWTFFGLNFRPYCCLRVALV